MNLFAEPLVFRSMSLSRGDWTLLVLAEDGGRPMMKIDFQKALFLLGNLLPEAVGPSFFQFVPHNYGPFSRELYLETDQLQAQHLVVNGPKDVCITDEGRMQAGQIEVDAEVEATIHRVVSWVRRQPFRALADSIYREFPEMKEHSVLTALPPTRRLPSLLSLEEQLPDEDREQLERAGQHGTQGSKRET